MDKLHITNSYCGVHQQVFADNRSTNTRMTPHVDAIQLIPHDGYDFTAKVARPWYAASSIQSIDITKCDFLSESSMQGITGFDGIFWDIGVHDCYFDLQSPHNVTFNGLVSGSFTGLTQASGEPVPVRLNPMRVGGTVSSANKPRRVYILSFLDDYYYADVEHDDSIELLDTRFDYDEEENVIKIVNFDLNEFRKAVATTASLSGLPVQYQCMLYQEIALQHGDIIGG